MKKYNILFISLLTIFLLFSCGKQVEQKVDTKKQNKEVIKVEKKQEKKSIKELSNLANKQEFDKVLPVLEEEYKKNPSNINNTLNYAIVLSSMASLTRQEKKLGPFIVKLMDYVNSLDPKNAEAYRIKGYAYEIMQNYDKAFKSYNKSIELDPNNALTYGNKGHAYILYGDLDKAEKNLKQAYKLRKDIDQITMSLAKIYLMKGKTKEALKLFNNVLDTSRNTRFKSEALFTIAKDKMNNGKYREAEKDFIKMLKLDPNFELGYIGLSEVQFYKYLKQLNSIKDKKLVDDTLKKQALNNLNIAIQINPNKTYAYYRLAIFNMILKNYQKTEDYFKKALEVLPNDITLSKTEKEEMKELIKKYYNPKKDNNISQQKLKILIDNK